MLYQDTLGPWFAMLQQEVARQVMTDFDDLSDCYVEFNVAAKLSGAFEDQAEILSRSVGAPWMTRNEARARQNLPHVDGADELIVPLNVIEGGQQSPAAPLNVTGTGGTAAVEPVTKFAVPAAVQLAADRALLLDDYDVDGAKLAAQLVTGLVDVETVWQLCGWFALHERGHKAWELHGGSAALQWLGDVLTPPLVKARPPSATASETEDALVAKLSGYYDGQQQRVLAGLDETGSLPYSFDPQTENSKLAPIFAASGFTFAMIGAASVLSAAELGLFKSTPMAKFLNPTAARTADQINATTYEQLSAVALRSTYRDDVTHLYDVARTSRARGQASSWSTTARNFGGREGALAGGRTHKTWVTTSRNPRRTHARLNATTVPIHELFGNGARYPGDPVLPEDERAKCQCIMRYSVES